MTKHDSMLQAYRILMPYLFESDKDNGYLLTAYNRDYVRIPKARILFKRNPGSFKGVWFRAGSADGVSFYMYNDDPSSRKDYWERLGKLYSHKHVVVGARN
jgi:hypothetical protein